MKKSNLTDYEGICRFLNYQINKNIKESQSTQLLFLKDKDISPALFRRIKAVAEGDDISTYNKHGKISPDSLSYVGSKLGFKIKLNSQYLITHED